MNHSEIAQLVREVIVTILPHVEPGQIRDEHNLKDLGADSIERIEIIQGIRHRLCVSAPLARFSTIENIEALVQFLGHARRA